MGAPLLTAADTLLCPHGGRVVGLAKAPRVLISGAPVLPGAPGSVSGCAAGLCATAHWTTSASRLRASGAPALLQSSIGECRGMDGAPTGPVLVATAQARVTGS